MPAGGAAGQPGSEFRGRGGFRSLRLRGGRRWAAVLARYSPAGDPSEEEEERRKRKRTSTPTTQNQRRINGKKQVLSQPCCSRTRVTRVCPPCAPLAEPLPVLPAVLQLGAVGERGAAEQLQAGRGRCGESQRQGRVRLHRSQHRDGYAEAPVSQALLELLHPDPDDLGADLPGALLRPGEHPACLRGGGGGGGGGCGGSGRLWRACGGRAGGCRGRRSGAVTERAVPLTSKHRGGRGAALRVSLLLGGASGLVLDLQLGGGPLSRADAVAQLAETIPGDGGHVLLLPRAAPRTLELLLRGGVRSSGAVEGGSLGGAGRGAAGGWRRRAGGRGAR
ncbi:uncharacterized protein LOC131729799 [Acipenser ruthenus]|uniref:uncharacterized protein LOC131729799 n=1 Tax=Acipenser ruthenus TaxID=7906 RepID=UPI002741205B|nr:uncharacterized protein LOC131729799 [Acipenser ruthenus]